MALIPFHNMTTIKKIKLFTQIVKNTHCKCQPSIFFASHPNSGTIGTVGTAPLLLHTHALMYITS